jgi:hypothetical protein
MSEVPFTVKKNTQVYYIDDRKIFSSYKERLQIVDETFQNGIRDCRIPGEFPWGLLAKFDLLKRIGRLGVHNCLPLKDGLIISRRNSISYLSFQQGEVCVDATFSNFKGSRPLKMLLNNAAVYFGEYFQNSVRESVKIFRTYDGLSWDVVWEFEEKTIRHVHSLVWDDYRKGIWVCTGDIGDENALWFTDDDFVTLKPIFRGSQKERAVTIIPTESGLIVPMDSPFETNYIQYYSMKSEVGSKHAELPGSAFNAIKAGEIYLVSTVTEPSDINVTDYATLWASLNGVAWKEISRLKRDVFPVNKQKYTRYAELVLPEGENNTPYIYAYARAINGLSDSTLIWKKSDILNFLKSE